MQSTAYIYIPHNTQRATRRLSLGKVSVILASFALWAAMIGGVALAIA